MNSLLGDIPTASNLVAGREGGSACFLAHVFKSNLNNQERDLMKFKAALMFKYNATNVQVTRLLVVIV